MLIAEKVRNNDGEFFKKFSTARAGLEKFLIDNKSLMGILLQNMSKAQRVLNTQSLFNFLIVEFARGNVVTPETAIVHLGLRGRVIDVDPKYGPAHFTDDVKSIAFMHKALQNAMKCPICEGLLDPAKSVSYDHRVPRRDGGTGDVENAELVHPYCNTGIKG